jgi:integrase
MSARVAATFDEARRLIGMNEPVPDNPFGFPLDDPRNPLHTPNWRVEKTREGFKLATDGDSAKEHAQAIEVLKTLLAAGTAPVVSSGDASAGVDVTGSPSEPGISVGEAARKYLLTLDSALLPDKTRSQKKAAVNGFAQWRGLNHPLAQCSRTDVAEWVQSLRASELATPTIANKASYLKACFAWLQGAGHYPMGDNPAAGQVKFGVREKRLRRKLGFEAFSDEHLRVIFSSESLAKLKEPVRWGAWLGLYSGARVSEIGQLRLEDFCEEDDVPCFRITARGVGQSLKTDASERVVPIHPELVRLGLLTYVEALRRAGKDRLFPRAKVGSVNGSGNFLSAAFGRHLTALGVKPKVGKLGFHSLRKTVVQTLQTAGVASEVRAQLVGHLLDDEHHATYSRRYKVAELAMLVHPALAYRI